MKKKTLVLFLGNSLFSDDRIGLELGDRLKERLQKKGYEVEVTEKSGLTLLDHMEKSNEVIIVDSIRTMKHPVGMVLTPSIEEFDTLSVFSPHYAGIPETLKILKALDLNPNCSIQIVAIEVEDPYTVSAELGEKLKGKVDELEQEVYKKITQLCRTKP